LNGWEIGADVGMMLTGVSAATAAYVWTQGQFRARRERKEAMRLRNWHGYIEVGGINTWFVRLAEEPETPTSRVVLDVVDNDGNQRENEAQNMRQRIINDGRLARAPTKAEWDFLVHLKKARGYGKGLPIEP
jgi:hypothetical protein